MFKPRFASALIVSLLLTPTAFSIQGAQTASINVSTAQQKINTLAVPFVPNVGQWDRRAAFKANTLGGALFVTTDGAMVYSFPGKPVAPETDPPHPPSRNLPPKRGPGWVLTETLIDAQGSARVMTPAGLGPNETKVSYFTRDNEVRDDPPVNTYHRLQLGEVYPGVNLQLRATGNNMEKIFTVAPGQNPHQIQMKLDGAERLEINAEGQLVAHTGNGPISFTAPIAFQEDAAGNREAVSVAYALNAAHASYGFALDAYDTSRSLVIDPLLQSTYVGGSGDDSSAAIAIHPVSGEVYLAGTTTSFDLPGTLGGAQPSFVGGARDAFVSRFNAALTSRLQSTYLAGTGNDFAYALAIHPATGDVYVAGQTTSTDLPRFIGGAQGANGGGADGFVVRLNAALTDWMQTTYVGGGGDETIYAIAIHPNTGEVYVAGQTQSTNLPGTAGGAQTTAAGSSDGFVSRFNAALTSRLQSTYLGGSSSDQIFAMTINPINGEIIVAGVTLSANLPSAFGGYQDTLPTGGSSAFICRLNPALSTVLQSTYLGTAGSGFNRANAVVVHPITGEIVVAGETSSGFFPLTAGALSHRWGTRQALDLPADSIPA